jgi:hypothetical protein
MAQVVLLLLLFLGVLDVHRRDARRLWSGDLYLPPEHRPNSQEPDGLRYVPMMWEIHETLRMLGKPEEFIIFLDGIHNLVKLWERLTSQQAAVDWFCFWLKGEEDPDLGKKDQYDRWHQLLKMQEQSQSNAATN